jgi:hypothetical protein
MSERPKTGCVAGGCGLLLAIVGIGVIVNALSPSSPAPPAPRAPPTEKPEPPDPGPGAYESGKAACMKALKAPATAKFSSITDDYTGWNRYGYNQWDVFGYVDAQNSFGAMIRENWEAIVQQSGPFYQVVYFRLGSEVVGKKPPKAAYPPR